MHTPLSAREVTERTPGVQEISFEVVAEYFVRRSIGSPFHGVRTDVEQMEVGRLGPEAPFV